MLVGMFEFRDLATMGIVSVLALVLESDDSKGSVHSNEMLEMTWSVVAAAVDEEEKVMEKARPVSAGVPASTPVKTSSSYVHHQQTQLPIISTSPLQPPA